MCKKLFSFLVVIPFLVGLGSTAFAEIVVEDAGAIWENALVSDEFPNISPRITTEYATTIFEKGLIYPTEIVEAASDVPARIVVEYASVIAQFSLSTYQPCERDFDHDCDVDGSDLAQFAATFGPNSNLALFAADFGRTNCP